MRRARRIAGLVTVALVVVALAGCEPYGFRPHRRPPRPVVVAPPGPPPPVYVPAGPPPPVYVPPGPPPPVYVPPGPPPPFVVVPHAPPPMIVEPRPLMPGPGHVWAPGHWVWQHNKYEWNRGAWMRPPRAGAVYVTPKWEKAPGGWKHVPGGWH